MSAAGADASDEALVAAFVAGDQRAFDLLVTRYQRRVYAICYRYFGNAADAEDAAQDAFVALLRRASTYHGAAAFSTWMYRVATNACNDLARKRSRRPQRTDADVTLLAGELTAEDLLARRELGLELANALAGLDPEHRDPVVLHDVEGWPYADIAERLGLPLGTVKSRIHRGHARLALALDHLQDRAAPVPGPAGAEPGAAARPPTGDDD